MILAVLTGLLTAAIATPLFRWHYRKINGISLNRRASWIYAGTVAVVITVIAYLTVLLAA